MRATVTCPGCNGQPVHPVFVDGIRNGRRFGEMRMASCTLCDGAAMVTLDVARRYATGRSLREARIKRRETMGDVAKRLGLSPVEVSHAEHARSIEDWQWRRILDDAKAHGWQEE